MIDDIEHMSFRKKKVLLLSTHDSHLGGHAWSEMQQYDKTKYDVKLVSLYSLYGHTKYSIIPNKKIYIFIDRVISIISRLYYFRRRHNIYNQKYCYFNVHSFPIGAKSILRKYDNGCPDVIVLHWYDGFITPKLISQLYKLTSAQIVFVFTDEYPLGGGCHYPCECDGYKNACKNCPALISNKQISEHRLREKIDLLKDIHKIVVSPLAGINKAKLSAVFERNTEYIRYIPNIKFEESSLDMGLARDYFQIPKDAFVVMYGAMHIGEKRKGFDLFKESIKIVANNNLKNIVVVVAGNVSNLDIEANTISIKYIGSLPFNDLCNLFSASNVYVSSSIADSGPMMVAYSIACGTPVVSYPIGYAFDCVIHENTGYIAEYESINDLANGIMYFYKNRDKQAVYRNNCIELNKKLAESSFYGNML